MWIRFINPFDWRPRPGVIQSFRPGTEANVTTACGEAAVGGGYAVKLKAPTRTEAKARKNGGETKNLKVEIDDGAESTTDRTGTSDQDA